MRIRQGLVLLAVSMGVMGVAQGSFIQGPVNPDNGFPLWYEDINGVRLQLALDPVLGEFDPPEDGNAFSQQIGFGAEAAYWSAGTRIDFANGGEVRLIYGVEAFFANDVVQDGDQRVGDIIRIRVRDVPVTGTYTVTHPFGQNVYFIQAGDDIDDVLEFELFSPLNDQAGNVVSGAIPLFLHGVDPASPEGFIGAAVVEQTISGSPLGTNFLRVDGPVGSNIGGVGIDFVETNLFEVVGQLVPEPASLGLLVIGGVLCLRRRR